MVSTDDRLRIIQSLQKFIAAEVVQDETTPIEPATPLWDWGLVDSFSMFAIPASVERELGVAIPLEEPTTSDFQTVETLADLVLEKRQG